MRRNIRIAAVLAAATTTLTACVNINTDTDAGHMGMDHGAMGDNMDELDGDMPGMMSDDQLDALGDASGSPFDAMWLRMMIEHHEGAIEMARTEQDEGQNRDAIALAEDIEATQTAEIATMEDMLAS